MASTDSELVQRWRRGDTGAFGELVRRHRRTVFRLAYAVLGSEADAEDVAQDAFVRAWNARARIDPRFGFVGLIRRITVNCAVSQRDRRRREEERPATIEPAGGPDPQQRVESAELRAQVLRAVAALPGNQRLAVTLFHLDGLDLAATAQAMGCSVGAVKSHLHRGRTKLAAALAEHLFEE